MSECETCGVDHKILRDVEDNLYRALCPCEAGIACFKCTKSKATHALLDGSGELLKYACKRHGLEEAAELEVPEIEKPGKDPKAAKAKEPERTPWELNKPLYLQTCKSCSTQSVSNTEKDRCGRCGKEISGEKTEATLDYRYTEGGGRTNLVLMFTLPGMAPETVRHFTVDLRR